MKLDMTSSKSLIAIGAGAVGLVASILLFRKEVSSKLLLTPTCTEALARVRAHQGAVLFLGEPIEPRTAKFNNFSMAVDNYSEVKVNVAGPKSNGVVYYRYIEDEMKNRLIKSIQLQIGKDDNKRLVIFDSNKTDSS